MNKFESLCESFDNMPCSLEPEVDFSLMCMFAGVASARMDNIFFENFGMSGASVLRSLRSGITEFYDK